MTITLTNNPYNNILVTTNANTVYYEEYGEAEITLPTEGLTGITYEVIS